MAVGRPKRPGSARGNTGGEPAAVGRRHHYRQLRLRRLNPGQRLAVLPHCLPADDEGDACLRHQIPFVAGVNEHTAREGPATLRADLLNAVIADGNPARLTQSLARDDFDVRLNEHPSEGAFGHPRGHAPGRLSVRHLVRDAKPFEELARETTDGVL